MKTRTDPAENPPHARSPGSWRLAIGVPAAIIVFATALVVVPPVAKFVQVGRDLRQLRRTLLERSDYPALLAACRQMMAAIPASEAVVVPAGDRRVPPAIRNLGARSVTVTADHVRLEFAGGFLHTGLDAYRLDSARANLSHARSGQTHRQLIPGLWYYDEE